MNKGFEVVKYMNWLVKTIFALIVTVSMFQSTAHARVNPQGLSLNGSKTQGVSLNGPHNQGIKLNTPRDQGIQHQGRSLNSPKGQGIVHQGQVHQGTEQGETGGLRIEGVRVENGVLVRE